MFKWIAPLIILIKRICGFGESFNCPCCGKKIYFCRSDKKDLVQQVIMGQFINSVNKKATMDNAFQELSEQLQELHSGTADKTLIKESDSLYGRAVARERQS